MLKSLNKITEEELKEVKSLAALFFTPKEIALMLELVPADIAEAMDNEADPFYLAFHGGRLQSEVDLRTSIIKLAKSGSSPAQTMSMDILLKSKIKMLDQ